jgi:pteridine reductase
MFDGKVDLPLALVTGAGRRLGHDFALTLARLGYAVVLHCHESMQDAQSTALEIQSLGMPAHIYQCDLTDAMQVEQLFNEIDQLGNPLKILVNSAAVMKSGNLQNVAYEEFDAILDLNLRAPFICAKLAAARMQSGGLIVNVSDSGAQKAWTEYPIYVVSKSGLESLTRVLARSLAPRIRVNAIAPGLVYKSDDISPDDWNRLIQKVPLKRAALEDEISGTLEFLVRNEYITGQTIVVDGGYSLI